MICDLCKQEKTPINFRRWVRGKKVLSTKCLECVPNKSFRAMSASERRNSLVRGTHYPAAKDNPLLQELLLTGIEKRVRRQGDRIRQTKAQSRAYAQRKAAWTLALLHEVRREHKSAVSAYHWFRSRTADPAADSDLCHWYRAYATALHDIVTRVMTAISPAHIPDGASMALRPTEEQANPRAWLEPHRYLDLADEFMRLYKAGKVKTKRAPDLFDWTVPPEYFFAQQLWRLPR